MITTINVLYRINRAEIKNRGNKHAVFVHDHKSKNERNEYITKLTISKIVSTPAWRSHDAQNSMDYSIDYEKITRQSLDERKSQYIRSTAVGEFLLAKHKLVTHPTA